MAALQQLTLNRGQLVERFAYDRYPRSSQYDPAWVLENQMGPNALWLVEALSDMMEFRSGMRILDLGCGKAMTSIFLAREFGARVWATDLWIPARENWSRITAAGVADRVFPVHAEARSLPYADGFLDAIVGLDAYHYFGTDVHYLEFHLLRLVKPDGPIGIVSPASPCELPDPFPAHLDPADWYWLNSVEWWRRHWARSPGQVERAELLPGGWEDWRRWRDLQHDVGALAGRPSTEKERAELHADGGRHLGFVRMVGRRTA